MPLFVELIGHISEGVQIHLLRVTCDLFVMYRREALNLSENFVVGIHFLSQAQLLTRLSIQDKHIVPIYLEGLEEPKSLTAQDVAAFGLAKFLLFGLVIDERVS